MRIRHLAAAAVLGPLLLAAPQAHAQEGFMFRQPVGQVTLRAGPLLPRAHGDFFGFLTDTLTLERRDFRGPMLGLELAFAVAPRWDVAFGVGYMETERRSEFRDWVGDDDLPIEQDTRLWLLPATASARFYPMPRGERVSRLAWIPARTTPYIGGGAGVTWYRLEQDGEFIDRERRIFRSTLATSGRGLTGHVLAGLDHWFAPRVSLNAETRYALGSASVGGDYDGWDRMDVSGLQFTIGVSYRW